MGCRLSVSRRKPKPRHRHHHGDEIHFLDEFGRPITVQLEERPQLGPMRASHWELPQNQRPCYSDPYATPDLYPLVSHDLFSTNGCVPSVSYSLDQMEQLDSVEPDWIQNQFSCPWPPPDLSPDPCLDPDLNPTLERLPPGPGFGPDPGFSPGPGFSPRFRPSMVPGLPCSSAPFLQRALLSEAETDVVSSLPGHTPSSRGSSPSDSLTSSLASEPSDSGFHSVSTLAGPAPRVAGPTPRHAQNQRGRWELQSIPENWSPAPHPLEQRGFWEMESGAKARCSVGNSTTTTVHFHRENSPTSPLQRSPTSPRQRSPRSPRRPPPASSLSTPVGCRTEPCHRRALWLQDRPRNLTEPNRSQTFTDLSQNQDQSQRRRASHPCTITGPICAPDTSQNRTGKHTSHPCTITNQSTIENTTSRGGQIRAKTFESTPSRTFQNWPGPDTRNSQWDQLQFQEKGLNQDQNPDLHHLPRSPSTQTSQNRRSRSRESLDQVYTKPHRAKDLSLNQDHDHGNNRQTHHSPLVRTSQTLKTRSNRESPAQFYSTVQSSPRPNNQRIVRRHRAPRLVRQRSEVTTDEEFLPSNNTRHKPGHKNRTRTSHTRTGPDQDPLMVLRDQNLDRIRTRQILDEWTTVEELLSHGTRGESRGWPSPLLSVTTV